VAIAYEAPVLEALLHTDLAGAVLQASGATDGALTGLYTLSHSATPEETFNVNSV
jgi:hypothetical protein